MQLGRVHANPLLLLGIAEGHEQNVGPRRLDQFHRRAIHLEHRRGRWRINARYLQPRIALLEDRSGLDSNAGARTEEEDGIAFRSGPFREGWHHIGPSDSPG